MNKFQILGKLFDDVDRLIDRPFSKGRVKTTRIKELKNRRKKLEQLPQPYKELATQFLDEVIDFATTLNEQGVEAAEPLMRKAIQTSEVISKKVDEDVRV